MLFLDARSHLHLHFCVYIYVPCRNLPPRIWETVFAILTFKLTEQLGPMTPLWQVISRKIPDK